MKVHSKLGPKEIPHKGETFFTDDNDDVDVPDDLGRSLLEQVDAWEPTGDKAKKRGAAADEEV